MRFFATIALLGATTEACMVDGSYSCHCLPDDFYVKQRESYMMYYSLMFNHGYNVLDEYAYPQSEYVSKYAKQEYIPGENPYMGRWKDDTDEVWITPKDAYRLSKRKVAIVDEAIKEIEEDLHVTVEVTGNEYLPASKTLTSTSFAEKLAALRGIEGFGKKATAAPVVVEPVVVEPVVTDPHVHEPHVHEQNVTEAHVHEDIHEQDVTQPHVLEPHEHDDMVDETMIVEPVVDEVVEVVDPVVEPVMMEPEVLEVVNENLKVEKTKETEGQQCHAGDTVMVHYTGRLTDGTVFDTSHKRGQPFEFQVGAGNVIKGWDEGIPQLKVGEKAMLTCSPEYGYGSRGSGKDIPPNATLIFEVELVAIKGANDHGAHGHPQEQAYGHGGHGQPHGQAMGYGHPGMGYGHPQMGYGHPQMGYGHPQMGYGHPQMGYGQPAMGYGQPMGYGHGYY